MVIISSNLEDNSILIRINCQINLSSTDNIDEIFSSFRALLIDSGYYLNSPLNIYLTQDFIYTNNEKYSINDDLKIEDLIEINENEKKQKNDAYRRIYPWQIISGRLLRYTTGDESCYTPIIEKCSIKQNVNLPLTLDLLIVVDHSTTINEVRRQLEEQLTRQLNILENSINNQINVSE